MPTPIGFVPNPNDLDMTGLTLPPKDLQQLFAVDCKAWRMELEDIRQFFAQFGTGLPGELNRQAAALAQRLAHAQEQASFD